MQEMSVTGVWTTDPATGRTVFVKFNQPVQVPHDDSEEPDDAC